MVREKDVTTKFGVRPCNINTRDWSYGWEKMLTSIIVRYAYSRGRSGSLLYAPREYHDNELRQVQAVMRQWAARVHDIAIDVKGRHPSAVGLLGMRGRDTRTAAFAVRNS